MDHEHVRADLTCAICHNKKDRGLLLCWDCYKRMNLRHGMAHFVAVALDNRESELAARA